VTRIEKVVSESLRDMADAALPGSPTDLADVALRGRARKRTTRRLTTVVTIVAVACAIAIPTALVRHTTERRLTTVDHWKKPPLSHAHHGNTSVSAQLDESPPRHLVAADDVALSAYHVDMKIPAKSQWFLYNDRSHAYVPTPWATLDVSPGMGLAAVLEGPTVNNRIGIVDMATDKVFSWISSNHLVGAVQFSPDGTQLLATTYAALGDGEPKKYGRNGIILIDLVTGKQTFHSIPPDTVRALLGWSGLSGGAKWTPDGKYVWLEYFEAPADRFLTLKSVYKFFRPDGTPMPPPINAAAITLDGGRGAAVSPDGTKVLIASLGSTTAVRDVTTGAKYTQRVDQLTSWASNDALVAQKASTLVLVSMDGRSIVPLTGTESISQDGSAVGSWQPLVTRR
jgi:WD40 repeat protein